MRDASATVNLDRARYSSCCAPYAEWISSAAIATDYCGWLFADGDRGLGSAAAAISDRRRRA